MPFFFRYQQAIADWQSWSENQNAEYSNLQTSLAQYAEAYNAVSAELAQLQAASSANAAGEESSQKDEEIAKLKAAVRAKGIEIEDLVSPSTRLNFTIGFESSNFLYDTLKLVTTVHLT